MPALKKKKFPVEIKWLNSTCTAYQIETSPAPLASSSTPSSYVLWLPCGSGLITEWMLSRTQTLWLALQIYEFTEAQSYCLELWDISWDDWTCLLKHTQWHPTSHHLPKSTPQDKCSPQSSPILEMEVSHKPTVSQQEYTLESKVSKDLEVSKV